VDQELASHVAGVTQSNGDGDDDGDERAKETFTEVKGGGSFFFVFVHAQKGGKG